MQLRDELTPPILKHALINQLSELSSLIDGTISEDCEREINTFNTLASTAFKWVDFQGINGGTDHKTWVKGVLSNASFVDDITYNELLELCRRVSDLDTYEEWEVNFYLEVLEKNLPHSNISNLIFWPDIWFEDEKLPHIELTDKEIIDWAITKDGRHIKDLPKSWKGRNGRDVLSKVL